MIPGAEALLAKARQSVVAANLMLDQRFPGFAAARAYYAMFYVAEALLLSKGMSFSRHAAVIAKFGEHFAKTKLVPDDFHRHLLEAQTDRLRGDYDTGPEVTDADAARHIEPADAFLEGARQLLT